MGSSASTEAGFPGEGRLQPARWGTGQDKGVKGEISLLRRLPAACSPLAAQAQMSLLMGAQGWLTKKHLGCSWGLQDAGVYLLSGFLPVRELRDVPLKCQSWMGTFEAT